jgi:hypothetical protein
MFLLEKLLEFFVQAIFIWIGVNLALAGMWPFTPSQAIGAALILWIVNEPVRRSLLPLTRLPSSADRSIGQLPTEGLETKDM